MAGYCYRFRVKGKHRANLDIQRLNDAVPNPNLVGDWGLCFVRYEPDELALTGFRAFHACDFQFVRFGRGWCLGFRLCFYGFLFSVLCFGFGILCDLEILRAQ